LEAKHKIVVNQLQLGAAVASPDATSLPVKLAIALLKDRNGVIDLDLQVSGNLDDPQFRLGPIIWKVVVNLIMKVVTSPFALLGSLFGGGEEISYIDFAAGSAVLDASPRAKLQTLAKALDSRPALNLDVPLILQPQADGAALAELHWHKELAARASQRLGAHGKDPGAVERLLATAKEYRALLETAYREAFGKRAEIPPSQRPAASVIVAKVSSARRRDGPGYAAATPAARPAARIGRRGDSLARAPAESPHARRPTGSRSAGARAGRERAERAARRYWHRSGSRVRDRRSAAQGGGGAAAHAAGVALSAEEISAPKTNFAPPTAAGPPRRERVARSLSRVRARVLHTSSLRR
jgi:hypothetical protein